MVDPLDSWVLQAQQAAKATVPNSLLIIFLGVLEAFRIDLTNPSYAIYAKKMESARAMLGIFVTWAGKRRVKAPADSAYCNDTVTRGLSASVVLFGAMRPYAVLTSLPTPRVTGTAGRPSLRGAAAPKPKAIAEDPEIPWESCTATLYGRTRTVRYKTLCAHWHRACGVGLSRIVIVARDQGTMPIRVFFRAAQRAMVGFDILGPSNDIKHLHKLARRSALRNEPEREMAA